MLKYSSSIIKWKFRHPLLSLTSFIKHWTGNEIKAASEVASFDFVSFHLIPFYLKSLVATPWIMISTLIFQICVRNYENLIIYLLFEERHISRRKKYCRDLPPYNKCLRISVKIKERAFDSNERQNYARNKFHTILDPSRLLFPSHRRVSGILKTLNVILNVLP